MKIIMLMFFHSVISQTRERERESDIQLYIKNISIMKYAKFRVCTSVNSKYLEQQNK